MLIGRHSFIRQNKLSDVAGRIDYISNGIEASIIRRWGHKYETFGEDGLEKQNADLCNYSAKFKKIVLEYLGGNITSQDLAAKYKFMHQVLFVHGLSSIITMKI